MGTIVLLIISLSFAFAKSKEETRYSFPNNGPLVAFEHVNVNVFSWTKSHEIFFTDVLRSPRDPRSQNVLEKTNQARELENTPKMSQLFWFNIGLQQFHIPVADFLSGENQKLRGEIVLAWPQNLIRDFASRLEMHGYPVTWNKEHFSFQGINNLRFAVESTPTARWFGPTGRLITELGTDERDTLPGGASEGLGIRALRFDIPSSTAHRICRFYQYFFQGARTSNTTTTCTVHIGSVQALEYIETSKPVPLYDGHHVALYVNFDAFIGAYQRAQQLIFHNPRAPQFQYSSLDYVLHYGEFRFKDIIDPDTNQVIYELEHEIRSLTHPGFLLTHRLSPGEEEENLTNLPTTGIQHETGISAVLPYTTTCTHSSSWTTIPASATI